MKASRLSERWFLARATSGLDVLVRRWNHGAGFTFPGRAGEVYEVCFERGEWSHIRGMIFEVFQVGDAWRAPGPHGAMSYTEQWCSVDFSYECRRDPERSAFVFTVHDKGALAGRFEFEPVEMRKVFQ
jgi:hypothetical protein